MSRDRCCGIGIGCPERDVLRLESPLQLTRSTEISFDLEGFTPARFYNRKDTEFVKDLILALKALACDVIERVKLTSFTVEVRVSRFRDCGEVARIARALKGVCDQHQRPAFFVGSSERQLVFS
jgi:hypothetical protein